MDEFTRLLEELLDDISEREARKSNVLVEKEIEAIRAMNIHREESQKLAQFLLDEYLEIFNLINNKLFNNEGSIFLLSSYTIDGRDFWIENCWIKAALVFDVHGRWVWGGEGSHVYRSKRITIKASITPDSKTIYFMAGEKHGIPADLKRSDWKSLTSRRLIRELKQGLEFAQNSYYSRETKFSDRYKVECIWCPDEDTN